MNQTEAAQVQVSLGSHFGSPTRVASPMLLLALSLFVFPGQGGLQAQTSVEYKVKGVFLFKLSKFVEWPVGAFQPDAPFAIGILGDDPFGEELDEICGGETISGRDLVLRRGESLEELGDCQIVFLCRSEVREFPKILGELQGRSVLTVADSDTFIHAGGMINFVHRGKRISFEINPQAAKKAGLRVSSQLLRLGIIKG